MQLHTNQKLVVQELQARGATIEMIDEVDELLLVRYGNKTDFLMDRFSSRAPFHSINASADKFLTKRLLKAHDICVPEGQVFRIQELKEALKYAHERYPLVFKPNWGSHGNYVQVEIQDAMELEKTIWQFQCIAGNDAFIIETFYPWEEHRFFITALGEYAVVQRQRASIIGNGEDTIERLINEESHQRVMLKKQQPTSLCPIVIDDEVHKYLASQDMDLNSVPSFGEQVFLRHESNLAKGGKAINYTHRVHPKFIEVAKRALASFPGLPMCGLDILTPDITQDSEYVILEVNSSPGLAMHTYPSEGDSVNVAKMVVNVMFEHFFD